MVSYSCVCAFLLFLALRDSRAQHVRTKKLSFFNNQSPYEVSSLFDAGSNHLNRTTTFAKNEKYFIHEGDMLFDQAEVDHGQAVFQHNTVQQNLQDRGFVRGDRRLQMSFDQRSLFWDLFRQMDSCKTQQPLWQNNDDNDRPTLASVHYIILPIWWHGEVQDASTEMNIALIKEGMDEIVNQYSSMSYHKHSLTYEVWPQSVLAGVTSQNADFGNTEDAAIAKVQQGGKVQFEDYSSILLVYNVADEDTPFGWGGWAGVNNGMAWSTYFGNDIGATVEVGRHEFGHNYGHPHHQANTYAWRVGETVYDGWDMMSGGNGYRQSDLAAASKWHFNWITDEAIVMMQPEGPTLDCPTCVASINNLTLKPFDNVNVLPSAANKMAVHIPILANNGKIYSYWLSYRGTGNDGKAAVGLSIHLSWFSGCGGMFGASYDSLNYDVFGDTADDTSDSFLAPNTCYVISPPVLLMDVDIGASHQVQPVVCVEAINPGSSIEISMSFLDPNHPPDGNVVLATESELGCSEDAILSDSITFDLQDHKKHLIHFTGTGLAGTINASLCLESSDTLYGATAYFYDVYPVAFMALGAPAGYGAFKSLSFTASSACGGSNDQSIEYRTAHGEAYVLIKANNSSNPSSNADIKFSATCQVNDCHGGQYMDNGFCRQCPEGSISSPGSTAVEDCVMCHDIGATKPHPKSSVCMIPSSFDPTIESGTGWRLIADSNHISHGWKWDITLIEFFSSTTCSTSSKIDVSFGAAINSGSAGSGWGPENAFTESGIWGGRPSSDGIYWIGMEFPSVVTVRCITLSQPSASAYASKLLVQSRKPGTANVWENVWLAQPLVSTHTNAISIQNDLPTKSPTMQPTSAPSSSPIIDFDAPAWRLWADMSYLAEWWRWDVRFVELYSSPDCSTGKIDTAAGTPISSGYALQEEGNLYYGPQKAFQEEDVWGGRWDEDDTFWIGMQFPQDVFVKCVMVDQPSVVGTSNTIHVQSSVDGGSTWRDTQIMGNLVVGVNYLALDGGFSDTSAPSSSPTNAPTVSPAMSSSSPTASPTRSPTPHPTMAPTSSPTQAPTLSPTSGGTQGWILINQADFEGGWGIWQSGGGFSTRQRSKVNSPNGSRYSIRLRKDAAMTTHLSNLDTYSSGQVLFDFHVAGFEGSDSFAFQWKTNSGSWSNINKVEFEPPSSPLKQLKVPLNFPILGSEMHIRFINQSNHKSDRVYIDNVIVEAR